VFLGGLFWKMVGAVEEKVAERKKGNLGFEDFLLKSRWTI